MLHSGNSVAQVHGHNLRDIIKLKKKKGNKKKKNSHMKLHYYILLSAQTDNLQILGQ